MRATVRASLPFCIFDVMHQKGFSTEKQTGPALTGAAAAVAAAAILTLALELCVRVCFALLSLESLLP